ncbi:MAG: Sporulation kinase E [Syntrophorhabdaceae bacterium PtaU1.Bin034]|nr:MAG: Sporulation kinase E [Syntrophorhabdaceae bacterium PtaU1.Bin034]
MLGFLCTQFSRRDRTEKAGIGLGLEDILTEHRNAIIKECIRAIRKRCGKRYSQRSVKELTGTVSEIQDGNFAALVHNDFSKIDRFIERITDLRLYHGFALSEVQQAFELHRTVMAPLLTARMQGPKLTEALSRLNRCLSYTITKFSDYYQDLHEKKIREYAETLEHEVSKRTRELSESEAKYRMLVEEINDGYFVHQGGRIVFVNGAFCEMHGYAPDEMIGHYYLDFVAPDSASKMKSYYDKRFTKRKDVPDQYIYDRLHKDGRALPTENKIKVIEYEGKYATVGICRDITERVKMEQRVRESERLAHIGQLTTSLAHEIRNPLSSIKMSIQMALKTMEISGNGKRTMEISAREIARLEHILTEMLDFARPVSLNLEPGSINEVIRSCLSLLDVRIREKNLRVQKRLLRGTERILMDREKIEQAIINILLNAIEALSPGGVIQIATVHENEPKPAITVLFSDDGPGASEEDLPYIFDPFFSKKIKGTGLGLSNVKKVVEAHGGTVAAKGAAKGFCLRLTLPLRVKNG